MTSRELKDAIERKRLEDDYYDKYSAKESALSKAIKQGVQTAISNAISTQVNRLTNDVLGVGVDFIEGATGLAGRKVNSLQASWRQEVDKEVFKESYRKSLKDGDQSEANGSSSDDNNGKKASSEASSTDAANNKGASTAKSDGWNSKKNGKDSNAAADSSGKTGGLFGKKKGNSANSSKQAEQEAAKKDKARRLSDIESALNNPDVPYANKQYLKIARSVLNGRASAAESKIFNKALGKISDTSGDSAATDALIKKWSSIPFVSVAEAGKPDRRREYSGPSL
jgi:hypothetical protein